jgi:uncharacterized phage-associated protein
VADTPALHDARAVANEILSYGRSTAKQFTVMQIIKLVYLAQGWSLALLDRPIVRQTVQAWQYGPVYPHIYKALSGCGSAPVKGLIVDRSTGLPYIDEFSGEELQLIHDVVDGYGDMHAFQLSNLMHQPGTPWTEIFEGVGPYSDIPNELIQRHFKTLS